MFSPLHIHSADQDPYKNKFKIKDIDTETLAGVKYKKITYQKNHGLLWRIGQCILGILASMTIVPIAVKKNDVFEIFKRVKTGEEIKVVYIKKNDKNVSNEVKKLELIKNRTLLPSHTSSQIRRTPPIGLTDLKSLSHAEESNQMKGILFEDHEILNKEEVIRSQHLNYEKKDLKRIKEVNRSHPHAFTEKLEVLYTTHNKPIIQQQNSRDATMAAAAMLILEHGGFIQTHQMLYPDSLNTKSDINTWIKQAGFNPATTDIDNNLEKLKKCVEEDGSAIVSLTSQIGPHVVLVDEVSEDLSQVRLRDPFHGWEITVSGESFKKQNPSYCVQIV